MEMNAGKMLDEACNLFNEEYSDEFLYLDNSDVAPAQSDFAPATLAHPAPMSARRAGFTARLYTRQE